MKKNLILTTLIFALVTISCQSVVLAEKTAPQTPKVDPLQIKNSTVLIVAESIQPSGISLAYGIGTLVEYQGETFLVTHNHWGDMLQDQNLIELRDGDNRMIKPIYASEFKSLVVYRDAGTLVLRAPAGLVDVLTPGALEDAPQLKPGDTVQVAHRGQTNQNQLEIIDAVVEEINLSAAAPVVTLRCQDGQLLRKGDSGGGVWRNGKLVANTWAILTSSAAASASGDLNPTGETLSAESRAAIFPQGFK